jgi:hypothetical protein
MDKFIDKDHEIKVLRTRIKRKDAAITKHRADNNKYKDKLMSFMMALEVTDPEKAIENPVCFFTDLGELMKERILKIINSAD